MTSESLSDSHRFGQRVKRQPSGYFIKPRSVALEGLLLNQNLRPSFISEILGYSVHLKTEQLSDWEGRVEALQPELTKNGFEHYSYFCGRLLALATYFGIIDLHSENIGIASTQTSLGTAWVPVPLDVEVILWNAPSGMDTLLYPSKLISEKLCGFQSHLNRHLNSPLGASPVNLDYKKVLQGFIEATEVCLNHLNQFFWLDHWLSSQQVPIRVLLRSTHLYQKILKLKNETPELDFKSLVLSAGPLLDSEIFQLQQNDIPYYFTTRFEAHKYFTFKYFSSSHEVQECSPQQFLPTLQSTLQLPSVLASQSRLQAVGNTTLLQLFRFMHQHRSTHKQPIHECSEIIETRWGDLSAKFVLPQPTQASPTTQITLHHHFFKGVGTFTSKATPPLRD